MKNKKIVNLFAVISSFILTANFVQAAAHKQYKPESRYEYATVLTAEPILKVFNVSQPEEQCFKEKVLVSAPRRSNQAGRLFSTFLGAAIGNAIGHNKTNKRIGTFAGAMIGSAIADDAYRNSVHKATTSTRWVQRCETVSVNYEQERVIGYRVTYLFHGETYTTRLKRDPGNSLRVHLSVTPMID